MNNLHRWAAFFYLSSALAAAATTTAFNAIRVGTDDAGFITLKEGDGEPYRWFPLGTFFYPSRYPELDVDPPPPLKVIYEKFAIMGGNLVVAPWTMSQWPNRPGALFESYTAAGEHLYAAHDTGVKLMADPALYWGTSGVWADDGTMTSTNDRNTLFGNLQTWIINRDFADVFIGYYEWDRPAWRYYDGRLRHGTPYYPTPAFMNQVRTHINALEVAAGADHGFLMVQDHPAKVHDLWPDFYASADIVGVQVMPYPDPLTLRTQNNNGASPMYNCLLPNFYASVTGGLADLAHEAARAPMVVGMPPAKRCKPYIAVLQAKDQGGVELSYAQMRFQAYDALIHGARGLVWYDDNDYQPFTTQTYFYNDVLGELFSLLLELGTSDINHVLKADYNNSLVAVSVLEDNVSIEESTFISGVLVPKSHFLSDRPIVEGIAKDYDGWTYLIIACRPSDYTSGPYEVRIRPYFSDYTQYSPWGTHPGEEPGNMVFKCGSGWITAQHFHRGYQEGYWDDTFNPGDVFIYKYQTPPPWHPEPGVPE